MREIKFKAKRVDNGEWVFGDLCVANNDGKAAISTNSIGLFEVDPETVCQYTGLKDKNGNEVYEGDELKYTRTNWTDGHSAKKPKDLVNFIKVLWHDDYRMYRAYMYDNKRLVSSSSLEFNDSRADENIIEIIGNIHDQVN